MAIDWSILNASGPVDIAGNFARGYQMGQAIVDKYHERNALASLAADPTNSQALGVLYQVDPQLGHYFEQRGADMRSQQQRQAIAQQYTTDPKGAEQAAVGAGEFDLAKSLMEMDRAGQQRSADFFKMVAPLAYKMRQMPDPAQRQAFLQSAKPMLVANGVDPSAIDGFDVTDNTRLDALIAGAQTVGDLINQGKIEWHQQGEKPSFATDAMGHPIGTENPALPHDTGNIPTVTDQKSYDAVPPGGHYLDPQGHMRVKGGQSGASPTGGFHAQ